MHPLLTRLVDKVRSLRPRAKVVPAATYTVSYHRATIWAGSPIPSIRTIISQTSRDLDLLLKRETSVLEDKGIAFQTEVKCWIAPPLVYLKHPDVVAVLGWEQPQSGVTVDRLVTREDMREIKAELAQREREPRIVPAAADGEPAEA